MAEGESDGDALGFSVCVLAVSSFGIAVTVVPVVLVPSSDVCVIGEVVLSDSDCEIVESHTLSLSRKREALFVESQKRHERFAE